jgi:hypothetical protein
MSTVISGRTVPATGWKLTGFFREVDTIIEPPATNDKLYRIILPDN